MDFKGKIHYEYPFFADFVEPNGALNLDKRSHACWYYTTLAMRARAIYAGGIANQIIEYRIGDEIPHWHESRDEELAKSIAIIYGLDSPDEFLKFKKEAWAQAKLLGLEVTDTIYDVRPGVKRLT